MNYSDLTVLVVDDDIHIRLYMEATLKSVGVGEILVASSVQEALEMHAFHKLDGAFVDLVLQVGNGLEIARGFASDRTPVVFCSSIMDEFNMTQMLELGWVLHKPVRTAGIKRALDMFLNCKAACDNAACKARK